MYKEFPRQVLTNGCVLGVVKQKIILIKELIMILLLLIL